jgi:hypothetical protein
MIGWVMSLHPLSSAALAASNLALSLLPNDKDASQLAAEHDAAAKAHRIAAASGSVLKKMHEEHARIHEETAESMRALARRHG